MTVKIDVLALAREADLLFNEHLGNEATKNLQHKRINAFAALVLERAAVECEQSEAYRGPVFAQRIRALKPALEKSNT